MFYVKSIIWFACLEGGIQANQLKQIIIVSNSKFDLFTQTWLTFNDKLRPTQTSDERNSRVDERHSRTVGHHITEVFHLVFAANLIYLAQVKVFKMALFTGKWDWGGECNQHQIHLEPWSPRRANDPKLDCRWRK